MKTKWKKIWLAALRGGNFKQGKYVLRNINNECCCLGVLADVAGAKWGKSINYDNRWACNFGNVPDKASTLNSEFRKQVGLTIDAQGDLCIMNDEGASFKNIADWIEKNL